MWQTKIGAVTVRNFKNCDWPVFHRFFSDFFKNLDRPFRSGLKKLDRFQLWPSPLRLQCLGRKFCRWKPIHWRGKVPNCPIAFEFGLCAEGRPHWCIKKPKRIAALRLCVQSYRHFTGILAYSMVFTNKLNDDISVWDFAHKQV